MMKMLIKGARVIDPASNTDAVKDILIIDGKIEKVEENICCTEAEIIDCTGLIAAPGLVDMHVHLRDPGQTHKEDVASGCRAAAAGGVTSLLAMPNTSPSVDNADIVNYILERAENSDARVYVAGAITKSLKGEEESIYNELHNAGAIALTDDGRPVENSAYLADALKAADALGMKVVSHCEDISLAMGGLVNEGEASKALGVKGIPNAAEDADTARVIAIAAAYDVSVHICHVSTKGSIELIRDAKKRGVKVTAETGPHYAALTDKETLSGDADYRMNPPLRSEIDRLAVIEALRDGTLDAIATDHAPHSIAEKADFKNAPNGVVGMETSLAACLTYLKDELSIFQIIEKMSFNPAKILGIDAGTLSIGANADIVIFDPDKEWTVDVNKLHGKSKNCVFKNKTLRGKVKYTILGGKTVYTEEE